MPSLPETFAHGKIELQGQFMLGSNYTFLVDVTHAGEMIPAVYKPSRGEQPLWDFEENTLALREVAAYIVSEALGFGLVPYTAFREDGPYGPGSLQRYIEFDPNHHYFNFTDDEKAALQPVALFDLLCNNADRKGSHVLFDADRKLWAIDHGLCFHTEDKLRTVIWDFASQPIPASLLSLLSRPLAGRADLTRYLTPEEIAALASRAQSLAQTRLFPSPPKDRRAFPYPPV